MSDDHLTYREYRDIIEVMADVLEDRYEEGHTGLVELVDEEVDSSQLVIYTSKSLDVLRLSDNGPGEWHHLVDDESDWQQVISTMAYTSLRADLWDELNRRGVEP